MKTTAKFPNWLIWLCFTLLMIALVALGYRKQANNPGGSDFDVYLQAARLMLEEAELYQVPTHGVHYYRYPPLLAFLMGPLARLSFESALLVWLASNAIIMSAVCLAWYRIVTGMHFWRERARIQWAMGGVALLVSLRYALSHFNYGQVNLAVLALLVFGCLLIFKDRPVSGGVLIGVSLAIKPFALPFLVWFMVSRRWCVLIAVMAGGLIGAVLPASRVGISLNLEYLKQWISHMADSVAPTNIWLASNNVSLYASLQRLFSDIEVRHLDGTMSTVSILSLPTVAVEILAWLVFLALLGWIAMVARKYGPSSDTRVRSAVASFMFALIPVLTTTAQKHYFVMIIPAIIYVLCAWWVFNCRDAAFRVLVVVSFVLLAATGPAIWPKAWAQIFQSAGVISIAAILLAAAIGRSINSPGPANAFGRARNVS